MKIPTMPQSFRCDGSLLHCWSKFSESPSRNLLYHTVAGSVCLSVTLSFLSPEVPLCFHSQSALFFSVLLPFFFSLSEFFPHACFVFVVSAYTLLSFQLRNPHTFPLCLSVLSSSSLVLLCSLLAVLLQAELSDKAYFQLLIYWLVWASYSVITSLPKFSLSSPIMHFI